MNYIIVIIFNDIHTFIYLIYEVETLLNKINKTVSNIKFIY